MPNAGKLVKRKSVSVGPVAESTTYATELEALKDAIEQARTSARWHGFYEHKSRYLEVDNKSLEDRIDDLEKKIELLEQGRYIANETLERKEGEIEEARRYFNEERSSKRILEKNYDELALTYNRMRNDLENERAALMRTNRALRGQVTRLKNQLGDIMPLKFKKKKK